MTNPLLSKNFLLLLAGQLASLFGNFILKLALSMYVLDTTGSAAVFAGILSLAILPSIVFAPLGGILADRADKRNMMVILDVSAGIAVLCAALLLTPPSGLTVICALLLILSVLGAFETPVVQACIPAMLEGGALLRGNAAVNQAAALASLTAPALGGVFYASFGLQPVMYASAACFLLTALLECFIRVDCPRLQGGGTVWSIVRQDFTASVRYIVKEQSDISKMLLLTALSRFFVMGITAVGLPCIVRTILGFDAKYYGAAESALAVAAIGGSIAAGLLKLKVRRLSLILGSLGVFLLSAGAAFLLPAAPIVTYGVNIISFCGMQAAVSIFSIYAVSLIQQRTPPHMTGKVMAYTSAITLCAQPAGQMVYGFLFDRFSSTISLVLIPTGLTICAVGLSSGNLFRNLETGQS